jgi:hypothetical protein
MNHGNWTPAQRTIIYGATLGRATLPEVNALLAEIGPRKLPESSYRSIVKDYVPYFEADRTRLALAIHSPPTWADLKNAA